MKQTAHALILGSLAALFSASALADHNSIKGADWANMPNDIHNTRIEDGLSGTEFRDFVRQGTGADTAEPLSGKRRHPAIWRINSATTMRGGSRR